MEKENKHKKNISTGFAGAGGAVLGATAAMVFPESADADNVREPSFDENIGAGTIKAKPQTHSSNDSHLYSETILPDEEAADPNPTLTVEPIGVVEPGAPLSEELIIPGYPGGEVEVVDYQRVTLADGNTMDYADVIVAGDEIRVFDVNQDGTADYMTYDANFDGIIEESEICNIEDAHIEMKPFQEAVGFDPYMAQETPEEQDIYLPDSGMLYNDSNLSESQFPSYPNELPDYVNDADIDSFMA